MNLADSASMRSHKLAVLGFEGVALLAPDGTIRGDRDEIAIDVLRGEDWVPLSQLRPRVTRIGAAPAWICKFRSGDGDVSLQYSAHNVDNVAVLVIDVSNQTSSPVGLRWRGLGTSVPGLGESRGETPAGRRWISSLAASGESQMTILHNCAGRVAMAMATDSMPPASALTINVDGGFRGWERLIDQCVQLEHPESARVESWRAMLADVAVYASVPPRQLSLARVCRQLQLAAQLGVEPVTIEYADDLLVRQLLDGSWLPDDDVSSTRHVGATVDAVSALAIALRSIDGDRHDALAKAVSSALLSSALWLERNAPIRSRLRRRVQSVPSSVIAALSQAGLALSQCASDHERAAAGREITSLVSEFRQASVVAQEIALDESPVDGWVLTDVASRTITLFADDRQVQHHNVSIGPIVTPLATVRAAVRWHGTRAALLWDISGVEAPITLRTGLDPTWHHTLDGQPGDFVGETLI